MIGDKAEICKFQIELHELRIENEELKELNKKLI